MTGTGKYKFPGQRAEVYPFQNIFPGIGGKFKRIQLANFGCTTLNSKITNWTNTKKLHIQSQAILLLLQ